jgi:hypothetical protein
MPDTLTILEAMYQYVAESPAGALATDVSGGVEAELVALNAAIEALDLLNGQAGGVNVDALARRAVNMMGDVFYDADQYADETASCPACGEDVKVRERSCPHCLAEYAEPLSKNQAIYEDAVGCVARAVRQALAAGARGIFTTADPDDAASCRLCGIPLPTGDGDTCAGCSGR